MLYTVLMKSDRKKGTQLNLNSRALRSRSEKLMQAWEANQENSLASRLTLIHSFKFHANTNSKRRIVDRVSTDVLSDILTGVGLSDEDGI